jgi:hypothetical protein
MSARGNSLKGLLRRIGLKRKKKVVAQYQRRRFFQFETLERREVLTTLISAVAPNVVMTTGGTSVTILGSDFNSVSGVTFGGMPASSYTVNSPTSITAMAPAHSAGSVDVRVNTMMGSSPIDPAHDQVIYQQSSSAPQISSVTPNSGGTNGGTSVTISGSNFSSISAVTFGGAYATSFTVNSPTSITATSPAHSAGVVDIVVISSMGSSSVNPAHDQFTFTLSGPTVTGVSPNTGTSSGGTSVSIVGTGFTSVTGVSFGGISANSFTVNSATSITAIAPAHAPGTTDVTVATASGSSAVGSPDQFTYTAPVQTPIISGLSTSSGSTAGGYAVTITGSYFTNITDVSFGGVSAASYTVNSASSIMAIAPAHSAGVYYVYVTNTAGTSAATTQDYFTFQSPLPAVTSLSASTGTAAGGTQVVITGSNFTGTSAVYFGAVAASSFSVQSPTTISAVAPAHSTGLVDITVQSAAGTSPTTYGDHFTFFAPAPAITGLSASSGATAGGTQITISGSYLTGATAVNFGTVAATSFTVDSDNSISATVPPHTVGSIDVSVQTAAGASAATSADQFTFQAPAPVITGLSVTEGNTQGGTTVTITGQNFTGATGVYFGNTAALFMNVASDTTISAVAPAGVAGTVDVTVQTSSGTSTTSANDQFTFQESSGSGGTTGGGGSGSSGGSSGSGSVVFGVTSGNSGNHGLVWDMEFPAQTIGMPDSPYAVLGPVNSATSSEAMYAMPIPMGPGAEAYTGGHQNLAGTVWTFGSVYHNQPTWSYPAPGSFVMTDGGTLPFHLHQSHDAGNGWTVEIDETLSVTFTLSQTMTYAQNTTMPGQWTSHVTAHKAWNWTETATRANSTASVSRSAAGFSDETDDTNASTTGGSRSDQQTGSEAYTGSWQGSPSGNLNVDRSGTHTWTHGGSGSWTNTSSTNSYSDDDSWKQSYGADGKQVITVSSPGHFSGGSNTQTHVDKGSDQWTRKLAGTWTTTTTSGMSGSEVLTETGSGDDDYASTQVGVAPTDANETFDDDLEAKDYWQRAYTSSASHDATGWKYLDNYADTLTASDTYDDAFTDDIETGNSANNGAYTTENEVGDVTGVDQWKHTDDGNWEQDPDGTSTAFDETIDDDNGSDQYTVDDHLLSRSISPTAHSGKTTRNDDTDKALTGDDHYQFLDTTSHTVHADGTVTNTVHRDDSDGGESDLKTKEIGEQDTSDVATNGDTITSHDDFTFDDDENDTYGDKDDGNIDLDTLAVNSSGQAETETLESDETEKDDFKASDTGKATFTTTGSFGAITTITVTGKFDDKGEADLSDEVVDAESAAVGASVIDDETFDPTWSVDDEETWSTQIGTTVQGAVGDTDTLTYTDKLVLSLTEKVNDHGSDDGENNAGVENDDLLDDSDVTSDLTLTDSFQSVESINDQQGNQTTITIDGSGNEGVDEEEKDHLDDEHDQSTGHSEDDVQFDDKFTEKAQGAGNRTITTEVSKPVTNGTLTTKDVLTITGSLDEIDRDEDQGEDDASTSSGGSSDVEDDTDDATFDELASENITDNFTGTLLLTDPVTGIQTVITLKDNDSDTLSLDEELSDEDQHDDSSQSHANTDDITDSVILSLSDQTSSNDSATIAILGGSQAATLRQQLTSNLTADEVAAFDAALASFDQPGTVVTDDGVSIALFETFSFLGGNHITATAQGSDTDDIDNAGHTNTLHESASGHIHDQGSFTPQLKEAVVYSRTDPATGILTKFTLSESAAFTIGLQEDDDVTDSDDENADHSGEQDEVLHDTATVTTSGQANDTLNFSVSGTIPASTGSSGSTAPTTFSTSITLLLTDTEGGSENLVDDDEDTITESTSGTSTEQDEETATDKANITDATHVDTSIESTVTTVDPATGLNKLVTLEASIHSDSSLGESDCESDVRSGGSSGKDDKSYDDKLSNTESASLSATVTTKLSGTTGPSTVSSTETVTVGLSENHSSVFEDDDVEEDVAGAAPSGQDKLTGQAAETLTGTVSDELTSTSVSVNAETGVTTTTIDKMSETVAVQETQTEADEEDITLGSTTSPSINDSHTKNDSVVTSWSDTKTTANTDASGNPVADAQGNTTPQETTQSGTETNTCTDVTTNVNGQTTDTKTVSDSKTGASPPSSWLDWSIFPWNWESIPPATNPNMAPRTGQHRHILGDIAGQDDFYKKLNDDRNAAIDKGLDAGEALQRVLAGLSGPTSVVLDASEFFAGKDLISRKGGDLSPLERLGKGAMVVISIVPGDEFARSGAGAGKAARAGEKTKFAVELTQASKAALGVGRKAFGSLDEFKAGSGLAFKNADEAAKAFEAYQMASKATKGIVIGHDLDPIKNAYGGWQALRMLDKDWTRNINMAWIDGAVDSGKPVLLVTPYDNIRDAENALKGTVTWQEVMRVIGRGGKVVFER